MAFLFASDSPSLHSAPYEGPVSDHFDGEKFHNIEPTPLKGFFSFLKMRISRDWPKWPATVENVKVVQQLPKPPEADKIQFTVVNHASVFIQAGGINILTDPVWSERCSPFSWAGPKRVHPPAIDFEALPLIHVVLISHNHYDHMDLPTLEKLRDKFDPLIITGLGNKAYLEANGFKNVVELDWWESRGEHQAQFIFVPSQHFSSRGLFDRNHTLWGGFFIKIADKSIYFAGDTGYGNFFKTISEKLGPADLSFIPIGAYEPHEFMGPVHMNPKEAVQAHVDLHSQLSVGIHYGTFQLTAEAIDQPLKDLATALNEHHIPKEKFITPEFGVFTSMP